MTLRRIAFIVLTPAALAVPSTHVGAQERDTVDARPDTVFSVEPLLVTATRLRGAGSGLGLTLTSLERRASDAPYAADILRRSPGSFLDEASGPGGPTIVRLRGGEEVFTKILIDGVEVNQNGGFFDLQGLTLSNVGSIDLVRGPQSAVYGSSAVSGVVHFMTPRGHLGSPEVTVRGEGGAASEQGGAWAAEGTLRGGAERLRYSLGVGSAYSRGIYALPHDTRTDDGSLRLDWAPADGVEAVLTARAVRVDSKLPVRDPGATRVPLDPNARSDRDRTVGALVVRYTPSSSWSHYVRASRYAEAFVYEDEADGVAGPEDGSFFVFDASFRFASDLERQGLEVGGAYAAESVRLAWGGRVEDESLTDHITGDFGGDPVVLGRGSWAGFGELAVSPTEALTAGAGLRVERYEGLDAVVTPRGSLVWTPGDGGVSLRAVVGRAYKAPNLQQQYVENPFIVANPDLRPETSTSFEVGVDVAPGRGDWEVGVTAFRQGFDDLIRTVAQEGDPRQINRNLGSAWARGVEWMAGARLAGPWWISSTGAVLSTEIVDAVGLSATEYPQGGGLPFRPSFTGDLGVSYRPDTGLDLTLRARGVGAQTVLTERFSGRREEIPGYVLVGLRAGYTLRWGAQLYLRMDNVLDRAYQTAYDRPGMPATGAVGVKLNF